MSERLKQMMKRSGNKFASIAEDGIPSSDVSGYIDTGSYMLNALISGSIYGGVPNNKRIQFAGDSTAGKTYFTLGLVEKYLNEDEENEVIIFESESAITKKMLIDRGIDVKRVLMLPVPTIEEFRSQATNILDDIIEEKSENPKIMFILDSLGNLSTDKEIADIQENSGKRDMTRAQLIRGTFRVITLRLGIAIVPLIMTNHIYQEIGMFPKIIPSGGKGAYYASDNIILLTKAKEKDGTDIVGNVITCTNHKSRLTVENKKVKILLSYSSGLDRYYGLLDLGIKYELFKKVANKVEFPDGTKAFQKAIYKNPEKYFTQEILDKLDECAKQEFKYGSADEDEVENEVEEENV